jgi:hypothetical protein
MMPLREMNIRQLLQFAAAYDSGEVKLNVQELYILLDALHACANKQLIAGSHMMLSSVSLTKDTKRNTVVSFRHKAMKHLLTMNGRRSMTSLSSAIGQGMAPEAA